MTKICAQALGCHHYIQYNRLRLYLYLIQKESLKRSLIFLENTKFPKAEMPKKDNYNQNNTSDVQLNNS